MRIFLLLILLFASYILGSIQGSWIASVYIYKDTKRARDWKEYKALHTFDRERVPVVLIDGVKIIIPCLLFLILSPYFQMESSLLTLLGGGFATIGHIFPFFRKGEGEAMEAFIITALFTSFPSALVSLVVFMLLYLVFGRKTIPFMVSVFSFPVVYILFFSPSFLTGILSILYSVLIVWRQKRAVNKYLLE